MASAVDWPPTPGRRGRAGGAPGLTVRACAPRAVASLVARLGQVQPLSDAAFAAFGAHLPATPRVATGRGVEFIWAGPGTWLVEAERADGDFESKLAVPFGGLAAICDQSDSRVALELAGARVRDVLAKGLPIDLHPDHFRAGDVALTAVGHVSVHVRQTAADPRYRLAVARSFSGSLWHWLESSAAEFGCEVIASEASLPSRSRT